MAQAPTFQDVLARLVAYWTRQGCIAWLPHNVEVGAGTMNPATFLRVLGPEPWNVAYVEPSIRPDDARYGENPNRVGRHHQLQVVLKPDPGDPQQLYLNSLAELGIDLAANDIRFVEDNWESPALGAWGLGWEVWLNGLEITQFTYFQQAGGLELDPVSVELTYGLDRIVMALQDASHFRDLEWAGGVTFGDLLFDYEVETSRYYFEHADVERLRQLFDLYEAEAKAAMAVGLVTVAHDYALKCSHTFNVLDARGAIGVTERAGLFGRMRRLSADSARAFLEQRRELGFPLLTRHPDWVAGSEGKRLAPAPAPAEQREPRAQPAQPADFVLEIGTEELPVQDVDLAAEVLRKAMPEALAELRLEHDGVRVSATPRRIAVMVRNLVGRQPDSAEQVIGPPARAAFDASGAPTAAATGFARSAGVEVSELEIVLRGGEERVAAVKKEAGRPASDVLAEHLPALIDGIGFGRTMRWNSSGAAFSRPVRWLVALHGSEPVPLVYGGLRAGNETRGLRPSGSPRIVVGSASEYAAALDAAGIALDAAGRAEQVLRQATALAEEAGGRLQADPGLVAEGGGRLQGDPGLAEEAGGRLQGDPGLVAEVANLVEQPHALLGSFEDRHLQLPAEVLVTVMKKHQRYFPVYQGSGALMARFVVVVNGEGLDDALARHGHEAVLAARFADAAYFWRRDEAATLPDLVPLLGRLLFERRLGTVLDKVRRLEVLAPELAAEAGLDADASRTAARAAALCKSDLASSLVVEMTSLQGVVGRIYAARSGERAEVAEAIFEHYLPRSAGDQMPATEAGRILGVADRLDSLTGLFAVGQRPTGTQDPFGLRRAAAGITSLLVDGNVELDLGRAVELAASHLPVELSDENRAEVLTFLNKRLEVQLRDEGLPADAVASVLAVLGTRPARAARAARVVAARAASPGWHATLTAYARSARIVRSAGGNAAPADGSAAAPADGSGAAPEDGREAAIEYESSERALADALASIEADIDRDDASSVLDALERLAPTIHAFFDSVLVMADDPEARARRLRLVGRVAAVPERVADLSLMEGF